MVRRSIQTVLVCCGLIGAVSASNVQAHGAVPLEEDVCVRQIGENMVHLSAYQPQHDQTGQYCTEIPIAGETYLVIDLIDPALRNMPVSLKVYRGATPEGETIAQVNADYYPNGVINGLERLDQGLYSLLVTAEGVPPLNYHYQLRVEMVDYAKMARQAVGPAIVLLVLSWLIFKLVQSGRISKWFRTRKNR
ncbi:hypothetical protein [Nitrosomonas mobilis]|uniref:Uncharacterized protein n=1 Tax=Nitrosomonas mobilis TaxID=51642 RepID=A0A1G5SIN5_9PROT|nr:hypothetical protein [Nitrosomonas mobilis]SCZ85185.1 conserved exported hypothetical protein [Nitrosomonas mobilis]SCZ86998.1 conserved exported hypothetical protein [Nitrosomonas mobilis]